MDLPEKFMISRTFLDIEHEGDAYFSGPMETFNGIRCFICCQRSYLSDLNYPWECALVIRNDLPPLLRWNVEYKIRTNNGVESVFTTDGTYGWDSTIMLQDDPEFFVNGNLTIECHVEFFEIDENGIRIPRTVIENETEIGSNPPRLFDESVKEFSDVVLIVEQMKFYVNKLFLASESSYFKSLFIGSFEESKKDEISLKDVEAKYFQLFLESLYGDPVINDETVDGILKLADMFDAQRVRQKCEVYLIKESKKSLKEKLDLAVKFNSSELKESCLNQIKTVNDIRDVMPDNPKEMDPDVLAFLLQKSLSLHK
ncbi:hypothetical protein CRE_26751 [Caenorhabditis remanei]|uniref:BTB domain-containing protein n=1 Tax=Caenorhabditis remanei TaxID=31234 RepID=E3MXU9_CAERE|nr:hypothetical protein CRE_26751 [Caenorhabditis remanei]